jgi:hypothetical protein
MLLATQRYVASGDTCNEKTALNAFPFQAETDGRSDLEGSYELFVEGDERYTAT